MFVELALRTLDASVLSLVSVARTVWDPWLCRERQNDSYYICTRARYIYFAAANDPHT